MELWRIKFYLPSLPPVSPPLVLWREGAFLLLTSPSPSPHFLLSFPSPPSYPSCFPPSYPSCLSSFPIVLSSFFSPSLSSFLLSFPLHPSLLSSFFSLSLFIVPFFHFFLIFSSHNHFSSITPLPITTHTYNTPITHLQLLTPLPSPQCPSPTFSSPPLPSPIPKQLFHPNLTTPSIPTSLLTSLLSPYLPSCLSLSP